MDYKGKFLEDKFVSNITKFKKNGNYIDICINRNSFNITETLENKSDFKGYHIYNQNDLIKFLKEDLKICQMRLMLYLLELHFITILIHLV